MTTYKSTVTLPPDVRKFFEPFMEQGTVTVEPEGDAFAFTFDAEDLWEAHEVVSSAANEAESMLGNSFVVEFERATKVRKPEKVKLVEEAVTE